MRSGTRSWLLGAAGVLLLGIGGLVLFVGGRPMLFGAMVFWGLAFLAGMLALASALPPRQGKLLCRALIGLVLAGCAALGGLEAVIFANSNNHIVDEPEVMVVLGAKLWDHEPSPVLEERLDMALEYLEDHPDMLVVVTGGMGIDEPESEASCMAFYLEARGIDPERIILEEEAANTMQNLQFSARLLEERGISTENLLVVTNGAHLARVKMLARRNGLNISTLSAPLPGGLTYKTYFRLREGAALVKSWIFDRGAI